MNPYIDEAAPFCSSQSYVVVDHKKLNELLSTGQDFYGNQTSFLENYSSLFSSKCVFLATELTSKIKEVVTAVERVLIDPRFKDLVRSRTPAFGRSDAIGAASLIGYDVHVSEKGVKLIEINTNPGGAMLNLALSRAQVPCVCHHAI